MNLSSYLQMPPAPLVPTSTSITAPQGARTGAGPSTGANLGFDFADVMARQMQRLVPLQRQTIAADATQPPEQPQEQRASQARPQENSQQFVEPRNTERLHQEAHDTRAAYEKNRDNTDTTTQTSSDAGTEADVNPNSDMADSASPHARHRARVTTQKTAPTNAPSSLEGLVQTSPVAPLSAAPIVSVNANAAVTAEPLATTTESTQTTSVSTPTPLQTIELSPQVRIITDPKKAPSPESLAAFAKSMGLDESTIKNLLGQAPSMPATPTAATLAPTPAAFATALTATNPELTANTTGLSPVVTLSTAANPLQTAIGVELTGLQKATSPDNSNAVSAPLAAISGLTLPTDTTISDANLGLGATSVVSAPALTAANVLPGLTSTDMAAIQQLQITVLPAAVLPLNTPVNTSPPSTIDMLSLFGTGVNEKDVSALLSSFSEETGGESNADQQPSQGDSSNLSSFAQTLNRNNTTHITSANATQAATPNMSEVYDQLSDKMATELAARMHKQLSDGEWKMKFALRPSNLGGVEIQLEMKDGKLDAVFRADNPLTRDLLQNSSQRLRDALGNLGINAGQVNIGQGGGNAQQNNSGNAGKQSQVRDNSSSQVNGSDSASSVTSVRSKANTSLLDLYA